MVEFSVQKAILDKIQPKSAGGEETSIPRWDSSADMPERILLGKFEAKRVDLLQPLLCGIEDLVGKMMVL